MILLLLNIFSLFVFVAIILYLMRRKDSANFQNIFDHYTQLGVLVTFSLVMINCIVLLDVETKLPLLALIVLSLDIISPFWVPLFLYQIRKRVSGASLRKLLKTAVVISLAVVMLTYSFLITRFILYV
ncbi:MAG: hypothetical protein FD143_1977 [Ignavibacteria bacterium]|nr:MAG: hypothetical protein FD143_1977 [Ignavibacteria bacterium]KAF0159298.1 MAG: hypothetical protein FD188_2245 [Ignavibacteria bacterium]